MKWQMMVTSLVLGLGISTQSFGFELLDQMLGIGGRGCDSKCCDDHAGCCAKKHHGCEAKCAVDPGCGVKSKGCCDRGRRSCASKRRGCCHREAKCAVDPGCGVKRHGCCAKSNGCSAKGNGCCDKGTSCCKRRCLLDALFSCKRCCNNGCASKSSCCEAKCAVDPGCCVDPGCHVHPSCGGHPAPAQKDGGAKAPMPPAPIVDPSAYVPSKRRVVQVSSTIIR